LFIPYHDEEWGFQSTMIVSFFEMLNLEAHSGFKVG